MRVLHRVRSPEISKTTLSKSDITLVNYLLRDETNRVIVRVGKNYNGRKQNKVYLSHSYSRFYYGAYMRYYVNNATVSDWSRVTIIYEA